MKPEEMIDALMKRSTIPELTRLPIGFQEFYYSQDLGVYPKFSITLRQRIKAKRATNCTISGEGGIGKTYHAFDICRGLSRRFTIHQVVFDIHQFLRAVLKTPMGVPIVFDEPSYAMSKREWYKELNQALVKTIESFRYRVHPLFIPIINKSLLDKTVRNYLLQFHFHVTDRGKATIYRLSPSQFNDKTYQSFFCKMQYPLFDRHLCNKDTCLGCKELTSEDNPCHLFRALYERKKDEIQTQRYEGQLKEAKGQRSRDYTNTQIAEMLIPNLEALLNKKNKISAARIRGILELDHEMVVGQNRSYNIKEIILIKFPQYA